MLGEADGMVTANANWARLVSTIISNYVFLLLFHSAAHISPPHTIYSPSLFLAYIPRTFPAVSPQLVGEPTEVRYLLTPLLVHVLTNRYLVFVRWFGKSTESESLYFSYEILKRVTANGPHPADWFIQNQKAKVRIPAVEFPPTLHIPWSI